jgi:hypothetical protein
MDFDILHLSIYLRSDGEETANEDTLKLSVSTLKEEARLEQIRSEQRKPPAWPHPGGCRRPER